MTVENKTTIAGSEGEIDASAMAQKLPWYCFAIVLGAACIPLGVLWDISWHESIGRDSFWTPAHMVIYLGGTIPGLACGWIVLKTTFLGTPAERARTVGFLGFRGPLGAWVTIWGALSMLTSAPFDNWWHDAYGLDVKILSPPHTLLAIGMGSVTIGALLLVLSWQNRLAESQRQGAAWLYVFMGGILLTMQSLFLTEFSFPNHQHAGMFYKVSSVLYPAILIFTARASTLRWPAVAAALVYMGIYLLMIWGLPLFPAQPKLAPIYNPITHMVPPPFPLLILLPALGIDVVMHRLKADPAMARPWWSDWLRALGLAVIFLILFVPVQWFLSAFLISPAAENWFFAGNRLWAYSSTPGEWTRRFWNLDKDPFGGATLVAALGIAWLSARFGLWRGDWMRLVKR